MTSTANPGEDSAPSWVLHHEFFKNRAPEVTLTSLAGVVVLSPDAPDGLRLKLFLGDLELPVAWGAPSPHIPARFHAGKNWANARFRANNLPARTGLLELRLLHPASGVQVVVGTFAHAPAGEPLHTVADIRARVTALSKVAVRAPHQHAELVKALAEIPAEQRDTPWFETAVLSEALFLANPAQTLQWLARIQKQHHESGSQESLDAFWREFQAIINPRTLTAHGYATPLSARDPLAVWRDIEELIAKLKMLGYECFINSGTLLGAIREGALIAHDDDVDLAVVLHADNLPDVVAEWFNLKRELARIGILSPSFEFRGSNHCKIGQAGGASVDLFATWVENDRVFIWPHTHGDVSRDDLLPLVDRELSGATVKIPRVPEAILESNYGKSWRIPDPTFRFDWKLASKRFATFCTAMKLARQAQ